MAQSELPLITHKVENESSSSGTRRLHQRDRDV